MLDELKTLMSEALNRYDINKMKIESYCEASYDQFKINCKESELKVLVESGTTDDYEYLIEEAENSVIESLKKGIDAIIQTFKKFCEEIKLKILSMITKKETQTTIDAVEKKIRFNPFLSKKKVEVEDPRKQLKVVAWIQGEYQKLIAKIKGGKEVDAEEVGKLEDSFRSKLREAGSIKNAMSMTLSEAIRRLKQCGSSIGENIEKARKVSENMMEEAKTVAGKMHASVSNTIRSIAAKVSTVGKEAINIIVDEWRNLMSAIRSAVSSVTSKIKGDESTNESVSNDKILESMASDMMEETADSDSILDEIDQFIRESASTTYHSDTFENKSDDDWMSLFETDVLA